MIILIANPPSSIFLPCLPKEIRSCSYVAYISLNQFVCLPVLPHWPIWNKFVRRVELWRSYKFLSDLRYRRKILKTLLLRKKQGGDQFLSTLWPRGLSQPKLSSRLHSIQCILAIAVQAKHIDKMTWKKGNSCWVFFKWG